MKKLIFSFLMVLGVVFAADAAKFTSCGAGYVLSSRTTTTDGVKTQECEKLWCRDLETGKMMGDGKSANSGYVATSVPEQICDKDGNCIDCFGARKWCGGEAAGIWNPEYGAYTRDGADNATYQSYQKGSCFAWRLEKPECPDNQSAVLQDGKWVCVDFVVSPDVVRKSTVRRTGAVRRIIQP